MFLVNANAIFKTLIALFYFINKVLFKKYIKLKAK